ncbi:transporter [Seonamhaeicola maritimus]|uniref:Transporter n=1 Tax=Seonamhaeicola maritimus TaxID=2591822 RepID=A0A5C7GNA0_9FLAO|nr:transporter [Seonamhaeicola maritimus]TXG39783.1 transporter [Seonamhaeicola maritimus]
MKPFKSTILIFICLITTHAFSQYTDVINSNRPGVSRSAFSVGKNVVQFEIGPYFVKEKRTPATTYEVSGLGVDFAARYGLLFEELEISLEGNYQNDTKRYTYSVDAKDNRANFKHVTLGAKYLVFDPYKNEEANKPNLYSWKANHSFQWRHLIPAISVYAGANYDTKNNPYTAPGIEGFSPKIMIATQNNFSGGWVFVMNLIKDRIGTDQSDFQYILTLTHSFNPKWVVFGETQGIKSDFYADNLFRVGGAYLFGKDFQLDTAITFNSKDTPSVFGVSIGASYRLDFHKDPEEKNSENMLESSKGSKRTKSSKRKKRKSDVFDDNNKTKKQKKKEIDFDDN